MASRTFPFYPLTGALPGKSFENQVSNYFEEIQQQIDDLTVLVAALQVQMTQVAQQASEAKLIAQQALEGVMPTGGIILTNGAVPAGWSVADGTAGTPDLREYVSGTLNYIVKA